MKKRVHKAEIKWGWGVGMWGICLRGNGEWGMDMIYIECMKFSKNENTTLRANN